MWGIIYDCLVAAFILISVFGARYAVNERKYGDAAFFALAAVILTLINVV